MDSEDSFYKAQLLIAINNSKEPNKFGIIREESTEPEYNPCQGFQPFGPQPPKIVIPLDSPMSVNEGAAFLIKNKELSPPKAIIEIPETASLPKVHEENSSTALNFDNAWV